MLTPWWHKQRKVWFIDLDGKRYTLAKGRANERLAVKALAEMIRERELLTKVDGAISVAGLCERFLIDTQERLSPATFESYQYSCQKLVDHLGGRMAHTIRPEDISSFSRLLRRTLNESSQGIVLRSVQRCFNWGVEEQIIPPHELGRIRKPRSRGRQRLVTDDEFQSLLSSTNTAGDDSYGSAFGRYLQAMDWTGCRPTELARLLWEDVHFEHELALLWKHKTDRTGDPRVIPLIPRLKEMLLWLKSRKSSPYVFLNSRGNPWNRHSIAKRMVAARTKAGVSNDVVPYSIRHRVATKALMKTGDLKMTSVAMGHTSVRTTERYLHFANKAIVAFSKEALG